MLGRMLGAARLSSETYEEVEKDGSATLQALIVVVIVTIASVVGEVLSSGDDAEVVSALGVGIVRGVVSWALWALLTWIIGSTILKTEKTEADWGQLARGTGFAQIPRVLNVFAFNPAVGWIIVLGTFIWSFACMLVAVRQSLDYTSTWRAFFVILISFIPVAILNGIVIALTGGE